MTKISDYYKYLSNADWLHQSSDDRTRRLNGEEELIQLEQMASESPTHQKLFDDFKAYAFRHMVDTGRRVQKPIDPTEAVEKERRHGYN